MITKLRLAFREREMVFYGLERVFANLMRNTLPILSINIDWFKTINDTYGHEAGDKVLRKLARIIQENFRSSDLAARKGEEQFALLLPDTGLQMAATAACRIQAAIASHDFILEEKHQVSVTVSIGICTLSKLPRTGKDKLYSYADQALYHLKRSGRNRISVFDPDTRLISKLACRWEVNRVSC